MFTTRERDTLQKRVLQLADADARVVAGAVVGSLADGPGDRWSDLDLTFGVRDDVPIADVLDDWTATLADEFKAIQLFDLPAGPSIYRVFFLPGCLQFDLSFTPVSQFGALGPCFRLLFGQAVERPAPPPPSARGLFGYAVHHLLRARFCIERGRLWQAEYWISSARDHALSLACLRRGLVPSYGRGFDDLPADVLASFEACIPASLTPGELLRALSSTMDGLFRESTDVEDLAAQVKPELVKLSGAIESQTS